MRLGLPEPKRCLIILVVTLTGLGGVDPIDIVEVLNLGSELEANVSVIPKDPGMS